MLKYRLYYFCCSRSTQISQQESKPNQHPEKDIRWYQQTKMLMGCDNWPWQFLQNSCWPSAACVCTEIQLMGTGLYWSQGDQVDMLAEVCEPNTQLWYIQVAKSLLKNFLHLQNPNRPGFSEHWALQFTINLKEKTYLLKPITWLAVLEWVGCCFLKSFW